MPEELTKSVVEEPTQIETEVFYIAQRKLLIPNAPGQLPSSVKVEKGQRFALDGTEPVDIARMLRQGAMKLVEGTSAEHAFIAAEEQERTETAAKRKLKKPRKSVKEPE